GRGLGGFGRRHDGRCRSGSRRCDAAGGFGVATGLCVVQRTVLGTPADLLQAERTEDVDLVGRGDAKAAERKRMRHPPHVEVDEHADAQRVDVDGNSGSGVFHPRGCTLLARAASQGCRHRFLKLEGVAVRVAAMRDYPYRWMRVDSTMAEVVRSTPSSAPMRSISASSSPIELAATIAIRSNGPLTECSTRTSGILRKATSI